MFYFSSINNKKVHDKDDNVIGRLKDIAIETKKGGKYPPVKGILVLSKDKTKEYFIEAGQVSNWSADGIFLRIKLADDVVLSLPEDKNILLLKRHIVDKQIVDLAGIKVVRVNDLQFGFIQGIASLLAIDVSSVGLWRRLGFKNPFFNLIKPHLLEWKDVHIIGDKIKFNIGKDDLIRLHPADIANLLEKLNLKQSGSLLGSLDEITAAKVLEEVQPEIQKMLVQHLGTERAMNIVGKMSTDELVDLIQLLPGSESRKILENLPVSKDAKRVKKILEYDEDEAGGLMTTEYFVAKPEMTAKETIEKIKQFSHQHRSIFFIYVLDDYNHYLGVVSLRRLIIADPHILVGALMKRIKGVPGVKPKDSITQIANVMTKYNLLSVAVLDDNHRMMGVVTIDDIMRCLIPNA